MCSTIRPLQRGPLFRIAASKVFLESPDQWLSPKPNFRSFAHTRPDIWRPKKCSTIRPIPGAHSFSFLEVTHFWKAPTSRSRQNFTLGHLLVQGLRCVGSKNALLSAPFQGPTV